MQKKQVEKLIESGQIPVEKTDVQQEKALEKNQQKLDENDADITNSNEKKSSQTTQVPTAVGDIEIPVTGVRRAIANNMVRAKTEVPHAWMMIS